MEPPTYLKLCSASPIIKDPRTYDTPSLVSNKRMHSLVGNIGFILTVFLFFLTFPLQCYSYHPMDFYQHLDAPGNTCFPGDVSGNVYNRDNFCNLYFYQINSDDFFIFYKSNQ